MRDFWAPSMGDICAQGMVDFCAPGAGDFYAPGVGDFGAPGMGATFAHQASVQSCLLQGNLKQALDWCQLLLATARSLAR